MFAALDNASTSVRKISPAVQCAEVHHRMIAACFIGGAATMRSAGKVMGAVTGAFIMGVMNTGMSIMGFGIDWQQVIKGPVLMPAVFLVVHYRNKG